MLAVALALEHSRLGAPVRYAELARALGVEIGDRVPAADVRAAVLDLRRGKGMVLDADDHDTWSAGSFFTNPVLAGRGTPLGCCPTAAPALAGGRRPGQGLAPPGSSSRPGSARATAPGRPAISTKHTLALTNRGGATTADLLALAREVRAGVHDAVRGRPCDNEPDLVGVEL